MRPPVLIEPAAPLAGQLGSERLVGAHARVHDQWHPVGVIPLHPLALLSRDSSRPLIRDQRGEVEEQEFVRCGYRREIVLRCHLQDTDASLDPLSAGAARQS